MTAEQEAKLYAAVLYAITAHFKDSETLTPMEVFERDAGREIPLDVFERDVMACRVVDEIIARKILG